MKTYLLSFLLPLLFIFQGCEENGDDGYYDGISRVYFEEGTMHTALGAKPVEFTTFEVKIPVRVLGLPASRDMVFKVKVEESETTAPLNTYTLSTDQFTIARDSIRGYVSVELSRNNIPAEVDTTYTLSLVLEPNENFELGIEESRKMQLTFSNYLAEPSWWYALESQYWGPYHPMKYQKMIEIWGGEISMDDYMSYMTQIIYVGQDMYNYFQEHPEFGMEFPENIDWPYVK